MNLYLKSMMSNFEPCVACLRAEVVYNCLREVHSLYLDGPLEEDVNACQVLTLLIFFL